MMPSVTSRSERVVQTLAVVDPEFQTLCEVLYGPLVDPVEVWEDVFGKAAPQGQQSESDTMRRLGTAATVIGGALGVKELHQGVNTLRGVTPVAKPAGRLMSLANKVPDKVKAGAMVAGMATMLGGDGIATANQLKAKQQNVAKLGVNDLVQGSMKAVGQLKAIAVSPQALGGAPVAAKTAKETAEGAAKTKKATQSARNAGQWAANAPTSAKIAAGVTGGALLARSLHNRGDQGPAMWPTDTYAKSAEPSFDAEGTFSKFDDDKRIAFGWASVTKKDGVPVVDRQGDYITTEDLEDAAYRYNLTSRVGGDMHKRNGDKAHHVSDLIESVVFTDEKKRAMGLPDDFPEGWWVGYKFHDPEVWQEVKVGKKAGFSIHGRGKRAAHELDGF
jgi:hypothetical protein